MNIIKLSATDSTNSYLKELTSNASLQNYTVVVAEYQNTGRGQMGTVWESVSGKNLTFSVLIRVGELKIKDQFYLSMAVALGVLNGVKPYVKNSLYVKWPNDILAEKNKIAGILIENVLKGNSINESIIGIGLNVNQENFSEELLNVTSLRKIIGKTLDKDEVLKSILVSIKKYVKFIDNQNYKELKNLYIKNLYKYETPSMFKDINEHNFLGKIIDVNEDGRLVVELEDEKTRKFNLKEIKFASR